MTSASSTINRIITLFDEAFRGLGIDVPMAEVERLGVMVHRGMGSPKRVYHASQHVIEVSIGAPPLRTLAALFHDFVYFQLDGGFPEAFAGQLGAAIQRVDGRFVLNRSGLSGRHAKVCADVFGFADGEEISLFGGLNEFASALVALTVLAPYLNPVQMLAVMGCIEATIPFRPCGADGELAAKSLRQRLIGAAGLHQISVDDAQLDDMVREAVAMANQDVQGFGEFDPGVFLANTWQLIEESNAALSAVGVYSVREYRQALARMEGFLSRLDPDHVFQNFGGLMGDEEFAVLREAAVANLVFGRRYLAAKLAAIAILEALAESTGGDCPVAMLLGDLAGAGSGVRVESRLPEIGEAADCDSALLDVLRYGRSGNSQCDQNRSPLSAFVYARVGEAGLVRDFALAKAMFAGELSPSAFLGRLERDLVGALAEACAAVSVSRSEALTVLAARL